MINRKWFLPYIVVLIILAGCGVGASKPIIQTASIAPTIHYSSSTIPSLATATWCTSFIQADNLPVSDKLRDSYIVYTAFARNRNGEVVDQDWSLFLKDGSEKLSPGAFPNPWTDSGQYIDSEKYVFNGNGYSLNSPNGKYIAVWKHWSMIYKSSDLPTLAIQDKMSGQNVEVFRGNPGDELSGIWSPNGNLFVFTYYNNIPEYYSLVYVVNADGTDLKPLTERMNSVTFDRPRWSPDGKKIAIPVFGIAGSTSILIISYPSGEMRHFRTSPNINTYSTHYENWVEQGEMTWSPDSQWFAYISSYGQHSGIEILNSVSGEVYCIESHPGVFFSINKVIWRYDNP